MINTQIQKLIGNPEKLSFTEEGERFALYCEDWEKKEISSQVLGDIWDDLDFSFFALKTSSELFTAIKSMKDNDETIIENTSQIKAPYLLYMLLWYNHYTFEQYLQLLQKAPSDNDSIFLPVILYMVINKVVDDVKNGGEDVNALDYVRERFKELSATLHNTSNGFYLAFKYVQYILAKSISRNKPKSITQERYVEEILCEVLIDSFKNEAKKELSHSDKLNSEELKINITTFRNLGTLAESEAESLVSFFTKCFFLQFLGCNVETKDISPQKEEVTEITEEAKEYLDEFQSIFITNDKLFFTHDFKLYDKHVFVASIFLKQANALKTWKEFYHFMDAARYKIAFSYFGDEQMELRYHFKFMFVVSLRMLDIMLSNKEKTEVNLDFWKEFWREGISYARRFSFSQEDFIETYLSLLITYVAKIYKGLGAKDIAKEIIPLLQDIDDMPYVISLSLKSIEYNNILNFEDFLNENSCSAENVQFFMRTFSATKGRIEGKRQEEEILWDFINKAIFCCQHRSTEFVTILV